MPDEVEASKDANEKLTCISLETYKVASPTYSKIHLPLHSVQMGIIFVFIVEYLWFVAVNMKMYCSSNTFLQIWVLSILLSEKGNNLCHIHCYKCSNCLIQIVFGRQRVAGSHLLAYGGLKLPIQHMLDSAQDLSFSIYQELRLLGCTTTPG